MFDERIDNRARANKTLGDMIAAEGLDHVHISSCATFAESKSYHEWSKSVRKDFDPKDMPHDMALAACMERVRVVRRPRARGRCVLVYVYEWLQPFGWGSDVAFGMAIKTLERDCCHAPRSTSSDTRSFQELLD
jgi:hypothetical protein